MYRAHAFPLTLQDEHIRAHITVRGLFTKVDLALHSEAKCQRQNLAWIFHTYLAL